MKHSAKITVYLSPDELFDIEHARLVLRAYGISVDRGRIVRAALALALADFDDRGERSELVDRLRPGPGGPDR